MKSSFNNDNERKLDFKNDQYANIAENNKNAKIKSMANIKYLKDSSYDLFNEIFNQMKFDDIDGTEIKIDDYKDFYDFQMRLNSHYNPDIKFFDYKNKINVNILKEIPYKASRLKKLGEENGAITISPNGHFVRTSNIMKKSESTLEHYNTVIGNSLILNGIYYYEIKILELGENTDMCFGIISKNSEFLNNFNIYKNFPFCEFEGCYGFNLNNTFYEKNSRNKKILTAGTIISIKVNLKKRKMHIYFDGEKVKNNCINIDDKSLGYYPAFSLSSGKEIQVKFGGMYNLFMYFETSNQIDAKPICQYNSLEKVVSCYMKIIENCLIKIINHEQISYNESIKYFHPMINFFANIAFNDEYIMKKYILKFMYKNNCENKNIDKIFDERYNFLYLIINNIEKNKKQKSILFLLDCLCEDIKNESYIFDSNGKMINIFIYIKLYNYFLKKNLIKEILISNGELVELVYKKIKSQLFIIFQTIKICGIPDYVVYYENIMDRTKERILNYINNKNYIECFSELIETLIGLKLENQKNKINKIDELIMKFKIENKEKEENIEDRSNYKEKSINLKIVEDYLFNNKKNKEILENENNLPIFIKNRELEFNPYRKIFLDLINDSFEAESDYHSYNIISTVFIPILNLYNNYYENENSSNYSNKTILSFLPSLSADNNYLNSLSSKLLISENIQNKDNKKVSLEDIIDINILYQELFEKKYNLSSYLMRFLITISSYFEKELFEFDLYLQKRKYRKIFNKWRAKSETIKINNYIGNLKKLIYLNNENNINIILRALNSLIPYFTELMKNNFYLFLPLKVINMLKFFIKCFAYRFLIYDDSRILKNKKTTKLIQLFVDLNMKLLYDENTSSEFIFDVLENIKFLYNMFSLINEDHIEFEMNDSDNEINTSIEDNLDFSFFFKDQDLEKLTKLIKIYYERSDKSYQKYFLKFIMYFNFDISSDNLPEENILIPIILRNIETDDFDFWFPTLIMDSLVKKKLIPQIQKTEIILNNPIEQLEVKEKEKLKKYFNSIFEILNFISNFIGESKVLERYFNFYLNQDNFEIDSNISIEKNKEKESGFSLYCYLIYVAVLIIKNLLNKNFLNFCQIKINFLNKHDFNVKYLIKECFSFLSKVFLEIPLKYEEILKEREQIKSHKKKKKTNKKKVEKEKEEGELDEDLKHFYINIINNIKIDDIRKLSTLLENNRQISSEKEILNSQLRKFLIFLNHIENDYNLIHKESNALNESQDSNLCPICLDKESDVHASPCDHMFCFTCIKKLNDRRCPICRKNMKGVKEHPEFKFNNNDNIQYQNNPFLNPHPQRHAQIRINQNSHYIQYDYDNNNNIRIIRIDRLNSSNPFN